jgi:hypothetical protein
MVSPACAAQLGSARRVAAVEAAAAQCKQRVHALSRAQALDPESALARSTCAPPPTRVLATPARRCPWRGGQPAPVFAGRAQCAWPALLPEGLPCQSPEPVPKPRPRAAAPPATLNLSPEAPLATLNPTHEPSSLQPQAAAGHAGQPWILRPKPRTCDCSCGLWPTAAATSASTISPRPSPAPSSTHAWWPPAARPSSRSSAGCATSGTPEAGWLVRGSGISLEAWCPFTFAGHDTQRRPSPALCRPTAVPRSTRADTQMGVSTAFSAFV